MTTRSPRTRSLTASAPAGPRTWADRPGRRERWYLTHYLLLIAALLTAVVLAMAIWAPEQAWARVSAQVGFLLTPFHTLLGIAIGYYFGDKRRQT